MKKTYVKAIVCILALGIFFITSGRAMAETISLNKLTDAEILSLLKEVQSEVVNRGIEKSATLHTGQYVGGKDIPVGSYKLICKPDATQSGILRLIAAEANPVTGSSYLIHEAILRESDQTFYINITEGVLLDIPVTSQLIVSGGIMFI